MGRGLLKIDSDQADRPEGLDVVRGYGVLAAGSAGCYCARCDLLVGLDGLHVNNVEEVTTKRGPQLRIEVESPRRVEGCGSCGVVAASRGQRLVRLVDSPCFGRSAGRGVVAQANLAVRGARLSDGHLHRAGRDRRGAACLADAQGVPVGDRRSCTVSAPAWPAWLGSSAARGGPCGRRSVRCCKTWLMTSPASAASRASASTSTSGITSAPSPSKTAVAGPSFGDDARR